MQTPSPDTKAVLLFCSSWDKGSEHVKPLTPSEYNSLAAWLERESMNPADLLGSEGFRRYHAKPLPKIEPDRLEALAERGGVMAIQAERWLNNGLWILSRQDVDYPARFKEVLGTYAPPLLYGAGPLPMLSRGGIALIGSRNVDEESSQFTQALSEACARKDLVVLSGGARGVDQTAMEAALGAGGNSVGVLPSDLGRMAVRGAYREAIQEGRLVLFSPCHPGAGFQVGNAMARNKLIYALADAAVVITALEGKGGTWAGAVENLKKWNVPLFIRVSGAMRLIQQGGRPLPVSALRDPMCLLKPGAAPERAASQPAIATTEPIGLDVYELILPHLLEFTRTPRDRKSIEAYLSVAAGQVGVWLKRAMEEGRIIKRGRPVRYLTSGDEPETTGNQLSLL